MLINISICKVFFNGKILNFKVSRGYKINYIAYSWESIFFCNIVQVL